MSGVPPAISEYVKEVNAGRDAVEGLTVSTERLQKALQQSGWTLAELDIYVKEHCLAVRSRSADGTKQFYAYLDPVDAPTWVAPGV